MADVKCAHSEMRDIDLIVPNPRNPNKHPENQIKLLAKIMAHQGWRSPVVISKRSGFVVKGHGRLMAAKQNGWKDIPVDLQDYATEADEFADMVADNKIAELAETDMAIVDEDARKFPELDLDLLGIPDFSLVDVNVLEPQCDEDEIPEVVEPKTKRGDIYKLGNHRLMCGDSTMIDEVEKLMNGEKADITFTSPPYNAGRFGFDENKSKYKKKGDDDLEQEEYFDFLCSFTNIALNVSTYVFFNNQFLSGNRHALAKFFGHYSCMVKDVFPWIKNTAPPNVNPGFFTNRFEFFLCLENGNKKKGFPVNWQGKFSNVIEGKTAAHDNIAKGDHSATMPSYVPEWFLERLDFVKSIYEPFGGSGTTLIAGEKYGSKVFIMELDQHYCDIIVARWEKYTGKKAELLNG